MQYSAQNLIHLLCKQIVKYSTPIKVIHTAKEVICHSVVFEACRISILLLLFYFIIIQLVCMTWLTAVSRSVAKSKGSVR